MGCNYLSLPCIPASGTALTRVSRAGTSNYTSQYLQVVIISPWPWYLLLAQHWSKSQRQGQVITSHRYLWDVITCHCPWYLLLLRTQYSSYNISQELSCTRFPLRCIMLWLGVNWFAHMHLTLPENCCFNTSILLVAMLEFWSIHHSTEEVVLPILCGQTCHCNNGCFFGDSGEHFITFLFFYAAQILWCYTLVLNLVTRSIP